MLETTDNIIGLDIYGPKGIYVGKVDDLALDTDNRRVIGIMVRNVNPAISEPGIVISIPYDWVSAVGDIVILKRFPEKLVRDGPPVGL